jgi:soluble lytic murein transglycosylase-like protein
MRRARSAANEVRTLLNANTAPGTTTKAADLVTGGQIDDAIEQAAARHNVDPNLVRAVIKVESNFNPRAVSPKGAMGLMQLMPVTARRLNVTNPFDPAQNVDAGVRHLKQLLNNFGGDVRLTLAAYNAGVGAVMRSSGVPPYSETRNYVKRITNLYWSGQSDKAMFIVPNRNAVRVYRDAQGVITMTNTD